MPVVLDLHTGTCDSKNLWISSAVIVPKSKKTLSEMIRPGSNFDPSKASAGVIAVRLSEVNNSETVATQNLANRLRITYRVTELGAETP